MSGADSRATSFGAVAAGYHALRPDWPAATAAWLVGDPPSGRRLRVLDLGAGTGKLTLTLAALGHAVVAVDPDPAMLDRARAALGRSGHRVEFRAGRAEAVPAADGEFDAVTVAQAWHWFAEDVASAECARVLRPGGMLGIAWHRRDEQVAWIRRLAEVAGRFEDVAGGDRVRRPELGSRFAPVEEAAFDYVMTTDPRRLRELADTWSYVRLAPDREARLAAVEGVAREAAAPDGTLVIPHRTSCYRAVPRP